MLSTAYLTYNHAVISATPSAIHAKESYPQTNRFITTLFQIASYLTDPLCKAHECYRSYQVLPPNSPLTKKVSLCTEGLGWAALSTIASLPAAALRLLGASLQTNPFIYTQGIVGAKILPAKQVFSLLSWNICCVGGGYSITDGGVLPWSSRIDEIIDKIVQQDADVNCLYETFDTKSAFYICERLKQRGYSHIYFNIGPKAIGVSSGIFIASKYAIQNPEFTPFPLDSLVGRTKNAAKGVFSFDLTSENKPFARIYATHLQHSEEPQYPTPEEKLARQKQMQIIASKVHSIKDRCLVVTGDLNLDDEEYDHSSWQHLFTKKNTFSGKTWGGDSFCAQFMQKKVSSPLNLDHTMIVNKTARSIANFLIDVGYDSTRLKNSALSDHSAIYSLIELH